MDTDKFIGYAKDAIMLYYHSTLKTEVNRYLCCMELQDTTEQQGITFYNNS